MDVEEFLAIRDVIQSDLMAAKTPEQFDEALVGLLVLVHERVPNPASASRVIGAFMRGVLEGAGCTLPWSLKKPPRRKVSSRARKRQPRVTQARRSRSMR
jgi:hypothetical protein